MTNKYSSCKERKEEGERSWREGPGNKLERRREEGGREGWRRRERREKKRRNKSKEV